MPNQDSNICTRPFTTGGICTSDVGGPLITLSGLIGIASWHRIPCASGLVRYFDKKFPNY